MLKRFRRFLIMIGVGLTLMIPASIRAQELERFGAFGLGYFSQASPQFQGWAAMGLPLTSDAKAISYTDYKIAVVPDTDEAYQLMVAGKRVRYAMTTGLGYRILAYGSWSLYGLAAPGFVSDGNTFKSAFEYGGFVHKGIGKGWGAMLAFTAESAGGQTDFAPRIGITRKF